MEEVGVKIEAVINLYKDKLAAEIHNLIMTQAVLDDKEEEIKSLKTQLDEAKKDLAKELYSKHDLEQEIDVLKGELEFYRKEGNPDA